MVSVILHASRECPIAGWLRAAEFMVTRDEAEAAAVIFTPERASAGPPVLPRIACLPLDLESAGDWLVASGVLDYAGVRADAYASDESALRAALQYVLRERQGERNRGPLC